MICDILYFIKWFEFASIHTFRKSHKCRTASGSSSVDLLHPATSCWCCDVGGADDDDDDGDNGGHGCTEHPSYIKQNQCANSHICAKT